MLCLGVVAWLVFKWFIGHIHHGILHDFCLSISNLSHSLSLSLSVFVFSLLAGWGGGGAASWEEGRPRWRGGADSTHYSWWRRGGASHTRCSSLSHRVTCHCRLQWYVSVHVFIFMYICECFGHHSRLTSWLVFSLCIVLSKPWVYQLRWGY